jgi:hypothetical protein
MKNKLTTLALVLCAGLAHAGRAAYTGYMLNEAGLAYSTAPVLDTNAWGLDSLSVQATYSSTTYSAVSFIDGTPSTGTITVVSTTSLNPAYATNTLTVNTNSALGQAQATNTLNVLSTTAISGAYINLNGAMLYNPTHWSVGASTTATAASIAAAINTLAGFTATSSGSTVTITAVAYGTQGNSYTLTSSTTPLLVPGAATFSGGQDSSYFKVNGLMYMADRDWTVGGTAAATALNIATLISAKDPNVTATTSSAIVTFTSDVSGIIGNSYTLTSSTAAALTAGAATFSGGINAAYVQIAGQTLTAGTDWTAVATASGTAKAISDAIMANTTLNAIVSSTWTSAGVVNATATVAGAGHQYYLNSWPAAKISHSPASYMNHYTASAFDLTNSLINSTSHGLTLGLPVLFATVSGTPPSTLVSGTTYYAIPVTADKFQLATTSTGAIAGANIAITTQTALGGGSYTVTPLAFAGTWSFKFQESNDGTNYYDVPTASSVTYSVPATTMWGGPIYAQYLRLNFTAGTGGGMKITVKGNGKSLSSK